MARTKNLVLISMAVIGLFACLSGCSTTRTVPAVTKTTAPEALVKARELFDQGNYGDAMIKCIDISRADPILPGLAELQAAIVGKVTEERTRTANIQNSTTFSRVVYDTDSRKAIPYTYSLRRGVAGETNSLRYSTSSMQDALKKKVTVHLDGVDLNAFILQIGASEGINIIADAIGGSGGAGGANDVKTMTLHAEKVPLNEILDFVSRNLGVSFYVGDNLIWATPRASSAPTVPLFTRLYRLRKGISSEEIEKDGGKINIVEAIERFIPREQGADLLFDKKAHVLIVKNTTDNLAHIEDIVETLDVCPPQVLIEARFIGTTISDLRELGIDWILNSPITVTKQNVLKNGSGATVPASQINPSNPDNILGFTAFPNAKQGLNLTYQGLLTDPMFKAVLHALDISGKAQTLSVPKVTTVNNRPAMIRIGEDFMYFEQYDIQSTPDSITSQGSTTYRTTLVPVGSPKTEQLGITLNVTPSVGADMRSITIHIVPEISEFVRWETYETGGSTATAGTTVTSTNASSMVKLPIFRRSKIETELIARSGETVVMGGLVSATEGKTRSGIPILSAIPLIGQLFRHDSVEEKRQNLLIFVTATILSERGEDLVPIVDESALKVEK